MAGRQWGAIFTAAGVAVLLGACGQAHKSTALRNPAEAVRLLQRQGYRPVPSLPPPGPGVIGFSSTFDPRYGQPVAYYDKGGLYVLVARGSAQTPRVPDAYWYRSGDTILIGWASRPGQRGWFHLLVEAL